MGKGLSNGASVSKAGKPNSNPCRTNRHSNLDRFKIVSKSKKSPIESIGLFLEKL